MGPGEEGFPVLNNGGMQLPPNPAEDDLLQLADEMHQDQLMGQEANDVIMQEQHPLSHLEQISRIKWCLNSS